MLQMYCSKCFRCFRRMLHVCLSRCCIFFMHMFGNASSKYSICFTHILQVCFIRMLQVFQLIQTYIASVLSRCCKSRYSVAYVAVRLICSSHLLQACSYWACLHARGCGGGTTVRAQDTKHTWATVRARARSGMGHSAGHKT
jgi:hypothetical protein